jgi:hypothetical protein
MESLRIEKSAAVGRKPNSVSTFARCALTGARATVDDNHSSRPGIADGLERPTRKLRTGRPFDATGFHRSRQCLPIWPCSVRGFACHLPHDRRGALLPHLFTIARLRPFGLRRGKPCGLPLAVYFLCHCPSSCPDRELPGALPCGVRTFLPSTRLYEARSGQARVDRAVGARSYVGLP